MSTDYYKILGIEKTASESEIKKAFRVLAHKHHPDKGGDEAKFKEINEAYQTLSDKEKRAQYDRFGSASSGFGNTGGFGSNARQYGGFNYSDFTRATGNTHQFKMFSLKKVPLIAWILLIPLLLIIAVVGIGFIMIYLLVLALRRLHRV